MKLLALFIAILPVWAQTQPDQDQLRGLIQKYLDARKTQQAADVETLFAADADQLVSSGVWRKGRAELVKGTLASSRNNEGERSLTVDTIRFVTRDVAIVDCRYEIKGPTARHMWSSFVFVRNAGSWRISAIRNMLPAN